MKCDRCRKRAATLHLTSRERGRVSESHLCEECGRSERLEWIDPRPAPTPDQVEQVRQLLACPSCRHLNQPNWNFCSACGAMREP